jgi:hypothetical protein
VQIEHKDHNCHQRHHKALKIINVVFESSLRGSSGLRPL